MIVVPVVIWVSEVIRLMTFTDHKLVTINNTSGEIL